MLKIFNRKSSDHPFADLKSARDLLAGIASGEPQAVMGDLTHWLQSVAAQSGFRPEHAAQALLAIDEVAQPPLRKLSREYLGSTRLLKQQEMRIWNAVDAYLRQCVSAFTNVLERMTAARVSDAARATIALLAVRALRSLATQLKWQYLRYGPVDDALWALVSRVYAASERARTSQARAQIYPHLQEESSMQQELLRLFMFAACSPGALAPVDMELAERLIAHYSPKFSAAAATSPETPYWVDLGAAAPPRRGPVPSDAVGPLGYFGAGAAHDDLLALAHDMRASGAVPSALNLGGTYETARVLAVIEHLEQHWSPKLPERKSIRQAAKLRLTVTRGFDGVLDVLQLPAGVAPTGEDIESWIMEDISAGGFGALVPAIKEEWLHIGCLLGLHYEGSRHWSVGIVRRLARSSAQQANVGIQQLSRAAMPVELRIKTDFGLSLDSEVGILLPAGRHEEESRIVLRPGVYAPGQMYKVETATGERLYAPTRKLERGNDYELIACREPQVIDFSD